MPKSQITSDAKRRDTGTRTKLKQEMETFFFILISLEHGISIFIHIELQTMVKVVLVRSTDNVICPGDKFLNANSC